MAKYSPEIEQLAKYYDISPTSLYRHAKAIGVSISDIVSGDTAQEQLLALRIKNRASTGKKPRYRVSIYDGSAWTIVKVALTKAQAEAEARDYRRGGVRAIVKNCSIFKPHGHPHDMVFGRASKAIDRTLMEGRYL